MTSSTLTPETETEQVLPPELWRAYRDERRMGSKQRQATSHAFERFPAFTKSDTREKLAQAMFQREAERGLALTEEEREEETLLEAEGVADAPAEPEPGSLGAIQADASEQLETLREQRQRLAPEALVDASAKAEMKTLEDEIRAAEQALDLVDVARGETGRRAREAAEAAARAAVAQAEAQARALQPKIRKAAERYDTAAATLAECAVAYKDLKDAQAGAIARTPRGAEGARAREYKPGRLSEALQVALRERGVKIAGIEGSARDEPLAASEPEKL